MRITDLLDARSILLNASPKSKNEALDQIVDLMVKSEKINDKEAYILKPEKVRVLPRQSPAKPTSINCQFRTRKMSWVT